MKKKGMKIKDGIETKLIKNRRNKMKNKLKVEGFGIFETRKKDGTVIQREETHNKITNDGLEKIRDDLLASFNTIAIGTGVSGDTVEATDTELKNEVTRALADGEGTPEAGYKAVFEKTFEFGSGEEYLITEAGVLDSITVSGSTLLDRFVFDGKNVDSQTDLYCRIVITVSRSA